METFDLNLRHLRALAAIDELGSLSAAAAAVSLTQPALTQGLAKLERQVGVALFERGPGGMKATAAGTLFAQRMRAALGHLAQGVGASPRGFSRPEQLMTMTQARALLALARDGCFADAARATGLSQPALHRSVRDLEQVVGAPLAERRGRGVGLTARGRRLARGVRLAERELTAALADAGGDHEGAQLTVGAMPLSRASLVPRAAARLMAEFPSASLEVVEGSWRELVEALRDGAIDLMVGALRPVALTDVDQLPLIEDRLAIVCAAGHPLAGPATPPRDALARYSWIVGPDGSPLRTQWARLFGDAPLPRHPIVCGSVMVIRGLLTGGDFLALLSPDQVALEIDAGILALAGPSLAASARIIGLSTRAGWRPTALQRRFTELLQQNL